MITKPKLTPYHRYTHRRLIRTILIPVFFIGAIIIVTVPLLVTFLTGNNNAVRNRRESTALSAAFTHYHKELTQLAESPSVQAFASSGANRSDVFALLYTARNRSLPGMGFRLISADGAHCAADYPTGSTEKYDIAKDTLLHWKLKASNAVVIHPVSTYTGWSRAANPLLVIAKNVIDDCGEAVGLIAFVLSIENMDQILSENTGSTVVVNKDNHVVYAYGTRQNFPLKKFKPELLVQGVYRIDSKEYMMSVSQTEGFPLWIYTISSFDFLPPIFLGTASLVVALIVLLAILTYRVSYQATKAIISPFDTIFESLEKYRRGGSFSPIKVAEGDANFIYHMQFNELLDQIGLLLKKNSDLMEHTKAAEIKALHAQFNPHFIFNMIDTIKYAIADEPEKAADMLITLSKMLRYTLDYTAQDLVPLGQDLQYINDYLSLQKVRLEEYFNYEIEVSETARECLIPRLIMLPIIENSIIHGYTGEKAFTISLFATLHGDKLHIKISDNGAGISPRTLRTLRKRLFGGEEDVHHIGLSNTHKRILLQFGDQYGAKINSRFGSGTVVTLIMSAIASKEYDDV